MSICRPGPVRRLFAPNFKQNSNNPHDDDDDDDDDAIFKGSLMQGKLKAQEFRSQERHLTQPNEARRAPHRRSQQGWVLKNEDI